MSKRKIVVGVDYQEPGDRALRAAFAVASAAGDTEVHAVHVRSGIEGLRVTARDVEALGEDLDRLRARANSVLEEWLAGHDAPLSGVAAHVIRGRPATALVEMAAALPAGLIVVGTHGRRGMVRALLGSVAGEVVAAATCPVLVARPIEHKAVATLPDVEPVCDACESQRLATAGAELWCARHSERHVRAHVYSYDGASSAPATRAWGFS